MRQVCPNGIFGIDKRSLVPVHHTARRRADDRERPGGRLKTESLFLFPSVLNRIRGLDAFAFAP